jgi:hypothetical protein
MGKMNYVNDMNDMKWYEIVDEILTGLSIEMIEMVFVDWMNRLQRLIDGNGNYVS